jgi:phenylalanine-4-hydroxylase
MASTFYKPQFAAFLWEYGETATKKPKTAQYEAVVFNLWVTNPVEIK